MHCRSLLLGLFLFLGLGMLVPRTAHAAVYCGALDSYNQKVCYIDTALNPASLCNDGTIPQFSIRTQRGATSSKWIIWLEGGSHCWDATSCAQRAALNNNEQLTTSNGWVAGDGVGILSPVQSVNPLMYNANTVVVHYCSSDVWSGGYSPPAGTKFNPNDPTTWSFQGRAIALSAIRSLNELGLNFQGASQIVLGGDSAGGVGSTVDANDILAYLPPTTVELVNDSGFVLDIGQFDTSEPAPYVYPGHPNAYETNYTQGIALWHGRGDKNCAATAVTSQQQVQCYVTSTLLQNGSIKLLTFVAESQIDSAQLGDEICPTQDGKCRVPTSPGTQKGVYEGFFASTMLSALEGGGTKATFGVLTPDVYEHVILASSTTFTQPFATATGSTTPQAVWDAWLSDPLGRRRLTLGNAPGVTPD